MDITVPDIGHFIDVPVIEVHVTAGDVVAAEDPLITLESDKATLDVPASAAGTVSEVAIRVGDQVSAGDLILRLDAGPASSGPAAAPVRERVTEDAAPAPAEPAGYGSPSGIYEFIEVTVPDIGHFIDVPVIEVHVGAGDAVARRGPPDHPGIGQGHAGHPRAHGRDHHRRPGRRRRPRLRRPCHC